MSKAKVVILEDDSTLASALKAALDRIGYETYMTDRPQEALAYIEKNNVSTLFVDCLLPSGSGVDFVESLRKKYPPTVLDVVMMSGIFTDSSVIKETLRATKATSFLKKPFELEEALGCVRVKNRQESSEELSPRRALYLLFNKTKVSVREKRKAIEALEEIHGFDLPYLYSLLVETLAMGHLNIIGENGDVFGISFSNGKIVAVDIADEETQLGKLLIEAGFIHPEDLKLALNSNSSKKLGEKLINGNLLSPHAFNIALANQMTIRLSRTIVDQPVKVNFVATDVEMSNPHIDSEALSVFLHDWVASKIDFDWLKAHYTHWGDHSILKTPAFTPGHPLLKMPLIAHFSGLVEYFTSGPTLDQLMDKKKFPEETAYKALHLFLCKGLLVFGDKREQVDGSERQRALRKLSSQFLGRNQLEIWDILVGMAGGSDSEPQLVITEFKRILGPEPENGNPEITRIYQQLKGMAEEALRFARSGSRDKMKEEMAKLEFETKIKAAGLYDEAKNALLKGQFNQALQGFSKASQMDPTLEKLKLYKIWAQLGYGEPNSIKISALKDLEMDFLQVPPEEKFDALYSFVMGLMNKAKGDLAAAKKAFEKAYNLDNSFIQARREIAALSQKNQKKDVMNRDLKDLVAGFFKKK
jgi:DNA-binding response OmpR family regulator